MSSVVKDNSFSRILVYIPGWVGDAVMATSFFARLRQHYPQAYIAAVGKGYLEDVLMPSDFFDEFIVDHSKGSVKAFATQIHAIKDKNFDVAILLSNSFRTSLLVFFAGIKQRIGYARNARNFMLTTGLSDCDGKDMTAPMFMGNYYAALGTVMGLDEKIPMKMSLQYSEQEKNACESLLSNYGITADDTLIVLNPGAKYGSAKCWPVDSFAKLAGEIQKRYVVKIVLISGPDEIDLVNDIVLKIDKPVVHIAAEALNLAGLKPFMERCDLLVTNDSGPRHYAVAFDTPVITMYGSTHQDWSDSGFDKAINLQVDVDCGPCMERVCPLSTHKCMEELTVPMVTEAVAELLQRYCPDVRKCDVMFNTEGL